MAPGARLQNPDPRWRGAGGAIGRSVSIWALLMLTEQQRRAREGKVEQEVTSSEGDASPEEAGEALDHVTSSCDLHLAFADLELEFLGLWQATPEADPGSAGLRIPERLRQECHLRQHESIKQPLGNFSAELASTQRQGAFA